MDGAAGDLAVRGSGPGTALTESRRSISPLAVYVIMFLTFYALAVGMRALSLVQMWHRANWWHFHIPFLAVMLLFFVGLRRLTPEKLHRTVPMTVRGMLYGLGAQVVGVCTVLLLSHGEIDRLANTMRIAEEQGWPGGWLFPAVVLFLPLGWAVGAATGLTGAVVSRRTAARTAARTAR